MGIVEKDLPNLLRQNNARTLLVSDALFQSFDLFPLLRSLGIKVIFETRCDVLTPSIFAEIADVCAALAIGFESASYSTLKRMNKARDRSQYEHYLANALAIFKEAAKREIPIMIFMIAGYPGDTEEDLHETLLFAREVSKHSGPGGHVFDSVVAFRMTKGVAIARGVRVREVFDRPIGRLLGCGRPTRGPAGRISAISPASGTAGTASGT